jgi:hypothetical protein
MDESLNKLMNKQFISIIDACLKQFVELHIENDEDIDENVKDELKEKMDAFKKSLKESAKESAKLEKKKANHPKTKKQPSTYNLYMKEKMAELKDTEPVETSSERFKKIAHMWKDEKETWKPKVDK